MISILTTAILLTGSAEIKPIIIRCPKAEIVGIDFESKRDRMMYLQHHSRECFKRYRDTSPCLKRAEYLSDINHTNITCGRANKIGE